MSGYSVDEIVAAAIDFKAELDRLFPQPDLCVGIELHDDCIFRGLFNETITGFRPKHWREGLPVYIRHDLPAQSWLARMADGSGVLHYRDGRQVRCLEGK